MGWLSSILSIVGNFLGWGREHAARKNAPDIKANEVARKDAALADRIASLEERAAKGDTAALAELRAILAE